MRVWLIVAAVMASGCLQTEPATDFDGQAAYDFVAGLTDNDQRARVVGTPAHTEGAQWLWQAMDVPRWTRAWQNFSGADYQNLDPGAVRTYQHSPYCREPDASELAAHQFSNLQAFWDAPDTSRTLLLAAHWDSKEEASDGPLMIGANDGASGVGVLLQLMRHMPQIAPDVDVRVVFFDGEDGFEDCHPLAGSVYYARTAEHLPDRMILLDMVGDAEARYVRETRSQQKDPELMDLLWSHGTKHAPEAFTSRQKAVIDDHLPFLEEGVHAVDIIDFGRTDTQTGFPPYWHTSGDTMANIDPGMLGIVGQVLWDTLSDDQLIATWPA